MAELSRARVVATFWLSCLPGPHPWSNERLDDATLAAHLGYIEELKAWYAPIRARLLGFARECERRSRLP